MIEPRWSISGLLPRDSFFQQFCSEEDDTSAEQEEERIPLQHDEPETPIHPELEYEILLTEDSSPLSMSYCLQHLHSTSTTKKTDSRRELKLVLSFILLVISGTGNIVTAKWQAIPMYNYPNFLNIFANFLYILVCFAYIIPVSRYGWFNHAITPAQLALPKLPFAIMGALDCLTTTMHLFASVYLPGPLLVLLPQAAIPLSMLLSRYLLQERYTLKQYAGAVTVLLGILIVLEPVWSSRRSPDYYCEALDTENYCTICQTESTKDACLSHKSRHYDIWWLTDNRTEPEGDDSSICEWRPFEQASRHEESLVLIWSLVVVASTIPLTISTIYKQKALGDSNINLDPIYLNGWIAVFQTAFACLLAIPAGLLTSPSVSPSNVPENLLDGLRCYLGQGSITDGCHPDTNCSFHAALFVNLCLLSNVCYTMFMIYFLKYCNNSSLLFLALTVMVPTSNLAFALPGMPERAALHLSDMAGLFVILIGLVLYRFCDRRTNDEEDEEMEIEFDSDENDPLRERLIQTGDV